MTLGLLGYGPVGDLAAIELARRRTIRPQRRQVPPDLLRRFEAYSRMLAGKYEHHGSGADAEDVEQEAMIAAWQAVDSYRTGKHGPLEAYVKERMRWRVLDFVRIRFDGQRMHERLTSRLVERE